MKFSLLNEFHVFTPLGKAICTGVFFDLEDPEWLTWITATGEPWWWTGRHIRRSPNATNALPGMSSFVGLNETVWQHIKRYKICGWLPSNFDPHNFETWET
jgi:hypothetical protein